MKNTWMQAARVSSVTDGGYCEFALLVATEITSDTEVVPNNIISGEQLVPHTAINVPSSTEASNNSDPQLVPHAAINVPSITEVSNNSTPQDGKIDLKLAALAAVIDFAKGIVTTVLNPPSSGESMYLVAIVIVLTANLLGALAALWVSHNADARECRTFKWTIILVSIAMILISLVLDVYTYKVRK